MRLEVQVTQVTHS